jgi:hypothetical protein
MCPIINNRRIERECHYLAVEVSKDWPSKKFEGVAVSVHFGIGDANGKTAVA